jgi:NDP-sugar pyrophosphorylase family protein
METEKNKVVSFKEKPMYTYYSNGGIYLIKKELLGFIPKNKHFNATDLMLALINEGKNVVSYPLRQYWLDIGKPDDFKKAEEDVRHLKLDN